MKFILLPLLWAGRKIAQIGQTEPVGVTRRRTTSQMSSFLRGRRMPTTLPTSHLFLYHSKAHAFE